jgi:DNA (cytosine-5)-methyltransferase 1
MELCEPQLAFPFAIDEHNGVWSKSVEVEESSYYWRDEPLTFQGERPDTTKPVVVELFCGAGGTSLGFELAGAHIALGLDIHSPSIDTFRHNHPRASAILGDIRKVGPHEVAGLIGHVPIDVLVAGVPCQGFSLNNRKRHENDKRNFLYLEFLRFVRELRPRAVVLENVSGMRSTGDFASQIATDISRVSGMVVRSGMLNAHEYGVPQRRQRLLFVGTHGEEFRFSEIQRTHGPGTTRPFLDVRDAIGDLPSLQPGEERGRYESPPLSDYQAMMRRGVPQDGLTNHRAPNHPAETIEKIRNTIPGQPMYPAFRQRIRLAWDILSPTQVSGGIRPQFQFGHPSDARGLTIRERCRIQSFPDHFFVTGGIVQGRVQTGNAVPPLLARAVGAALIKTL